MSHGLVIGKFYPPHKGHKHLIETARSQVDRLTVMICVHESQTISGEVRFSWLAEIHPDCDVVAVPDTLPEEPTAWAQFVMAYFGRAPDVVFTSEDYGAPFADALGARHVLVDRERLAFPVSGTSVRNDPLGNWEFLEPCVRAHYAKRVVLTGAESTGKTTMAARLASVFGTVWVPEYGREYWEEIKLKGLGSVARPDFEAPDWSTEEFVHIAQTQQDRENEAARLADRVLICDTNAWTTGFWHDRYLGFRSDIVDSIGQVDKCDKYVVCHPDVPFVQDGFRDGEGVRLAMHEKIVMGLCDTSTPAVHLTGSWSDRESTAIRAVVQALGRGLPGQK